MDVGKFIATDGTQIKHGYEEAVIRV